MGSEMCIRDRNDIICHQKNFSLFDAYSANEAFVTGTFGGITPVTHIDGKQIGIGNFGSISKKLSNLYEQLILQEVG